MAQGQAVNTRSQLTIVFNATAAGVGKEDIRARLAELFRAHAMEVAIWFAHSGPELVALARQSARHAGETVVAGGGDGTINAVVSALLGTDKILGVLPLGTLNHFAKDLQIPLDLESSVQTHH
jgi:diacylglycerol kinase family enzyme